VGGNEVEHRDARQKAIHQVGPLGTEGAECADRSIGEPALTTSNGNRLRVADRIDGVS